MKRFLIILCFLFSFSFVVLGNVPLKANEEHVYDFAQLFTEEEKAILENKLDTLSQNEQMDVSILTTEDAEGKTSRDYADDFYDRNGFGYGSTKDGLLLLLDMDNREVYISTCGQAIAVFTDNRINQMLEHIVYYMKDGAYDKAALTFIEDCTTYLKAGVPQNSAFNSTSNRTQKGKKTSLVETLLMALGIAAGVTLIVRFSVIYKYKKPSRSLPPMLPLNVHFLEHSDRFVTSHTTRVYVPKNDNHNNGSFGGGSSTHTSSSGTTHGGGGMGF